MKLLLVAILALIGGPAIFYGVYYLMPAQVERYGADTVVLGSAAIFFLLSLGWTIFTLVFVRGKKDFR